jgi:heavy metal sensor kinase
MRSIRLSLVVYFLVLLAVALGAASMLAYENADSLLRRATSDHRKDLEKTYLAECKKETEKFDEALKQRCSYLGGQAARQYFNRRWRLIAMFPLSYLTPSADGSPLLLPFWLSEFGRNRLIDVMSTFATEFQYVEPPEHEDVLQGYANGQVVEYFQISTEKGHWRSRSMIDHSFSFEFNAERFHAMPADSPQLDDVKMPSGEDPAPDLRRVTLRYPIAPRFFGGPRRGGRQADRPPPPPDAGRFGPVFYIQVQCAADTHYRDEALAKLERDFESDVATFDQESRGHLRALGSRLLLICLTTFAATIVGGVLLVRIGLAPLRRLSVAVSQVSEKDFRLPIDESQLPLELRPISERLTQTLDELKRAFAREKQAAADISHELRTPLAALLTTIEVGLKKPRSPEEYREMLEDCHATGTQMSHLVERLLTLARLDAGVDTLRSRQVDVAALAEQCAEMVRPLAKAHGLSLTMHRNGPITVHTDPDKLREVLNNLLHNAVEYNRPDGSIDLSVDRSGDSLWLEVRDTGIGITPSAREHIFERFYRVDPSRQATGLHAGLGLAIVKDYVDLLGGVISVESTEGKGSTFRIELPVGRTTVAHRSVQESVA